MRLTLPQALAQTYANQIAFDQGMTAAVKGQAYDSNPFDRAAQANFHLQWSKGHNGMRARMAMDKDNA